MEVRQFYAAPRNLHWGMRRSLS